MKHLYIHSPSVVVAGQVAGSWAGTYPVALVPITSITTGSMEDIRKGMTVIFGSAAGLDDLGRQRCRKDQAGSDTDLEIGYSSKGKVDGCVDLSVGSYFTVLDEYRVWAKNQRFFESGSEPYVTVLKDYDLSFEGLNQEFGLYPKANAGAARAGNIDSGTSVLELDFDGTGSYSLPLGVGITTYLWEVGDGTITVGTSASSTITATFPAGFRYVYLTVTDANGYDHRMAIPVYARDPDADTCVEVWQYDIERNQEGQRASIKIFSDLPRSTYPDGAVVLIFDDTDVDSIVKFYGWIYTDPMNLSFVETGALRDTVLEAYDIAGMLDTIPGQTLSVENRFDQYSFVVTADATAGALILIVEPITFPLRIGDTLDLNGGGVYTITMTSTAAIGATALGVAATPVDIFIDDTLDLDVYPRVWGEIYHPEMYTVMDFILRWHSTALEMADFIHAPLDAGWTFDVALRECSANSIFRQIQEQAHSICTDHNIGCNMGGQLILSNDPMLLGSINRTSTVQADLNGHILAVSSVHRRPSKYQWIRGGAILEDWAPLATTIQVDYVIRPSALASAGATSINVYPLPVDIPDATVLYLIGLEGQLLPRITLSAAASANDTTISCVALSIQADIWDEYQYTASEAGPSRIRKTFGIAPGLTPGQGSETLTINNKIADNNGNLLSTIGHLWARYNSEWEPFDVEVDQSFTEDIEPVYFTWVTGSELAAKYIPQRNLPFFETDTRFLPLSVSLSFSSSDEGLERSMSLRLERETLGTSGVELDEDTV